MTDDRPMSTPPGNFSEKAVEASRRGSRSVRQAVSALGRVCAAMPHLSGLAAAAEVRFTYRFTETACVTSSGLLLVNPDWFGQLDERDSAFVIAHELLHLAMEHHARSESDDPKIHNIASDYIINDLLVEAFGYVPAFGGLFMPGARHYSTERLVLELRKQAGAYDRDLNNLGEAFDQKSKGDRRESSFPEEGVLSGDLIDEAVENEWFPDDAAKRKRRKERVRRKIVEIGELRDTLERMERVVRLGRDGRDRWAGDLYSAAAEAVETPYVPPWQLALQQSLEGLLPPARSYARASRRNSAHDPSIVLPGRVRPPAMTLAVVLDTSGSMIWVIPRLLGVIASFCVTNDVSRIRILQCDTSVTEDEWLTPSDLVRYEIKGYGGSDMSPAMERLAADPAIEAAVVVTDGDICYPATRMPYEVVWAVTDDGGWFQPGYGTVVGIPPAVVRG